MVAGTVQVRELVVSKCSYSSQKLKYEYKFIEKLELLFPPTSIAKPPTKGQWRPHREPGLPSPGSNKILPHQSLID
jgi:hypothetical protein